MIVARTLLALEPDVLAAIAAELAETLTTWGPLSFAKTKQAIDALVERHDPAARRRTESAIRSVTSISALRRDDSSDAIECGTRA